jgi:hypothetical protein
MSRVHSRRNFLLFAPAAVAPFFMARGVFAQNPPQGGQSGNPNPNRPLGIGGGGGFGGGAMAPGPAARDDDFKSGKVSGTHDKNHAEPPPKPRKDLAADQKSMRNEVQQLVRDTQELKKAIEQVGPKQQLYVELVGKTKEIEKLAHDIAALAKG